MAPLLNLFFKLGLFSVRPTLFDHIYSMKAKFKIYNEFMFNKVSYYLYLVRSGKRSERVDLQVRKSNPILQLVILARAAVAEACASVTAFCLQTIAYYFA